MAHPPHDWDGDPDVALDAVALLQAHIDRDAKAAIVILAGCCGQCVASTLADWLAHLVTGLPGARDPAEVAARLDQMRRTVLGGGE